MVIDGSAVPAIRLMEPDAKYLARAIEAGLPRPIPSATLLYKGGGFARTDMAAG